MKAIIAILLMTTTTVFAQQSPQAEQLFRNGRELVKQGKYAEGCAKLEASQKLESNINTLLNLGACREKNGQVATAWAVFLQAAAEARKSGDQQLLKIANDFIAKLEPRLSYVTVSVPDTSRVDGLVLTLDGRTLDTAEYNQGIPVDAGPHEVSGSAPGHEPWTTKLAVLDTERKSVEVPRFKELSKLAPHDPVNQNNAPAHPVAPIAGPEDKPGMTGLRKVAIGAAAVGVIGLVGMTVFGLQASSDWSTAQDTNNDQLRKDAESKATLATVSGIIGIAGVATGVTLWIVGGAEHPDRTALRPSVSRDSVGFVVGGTF